MFLMWNMARVSEICDKTKIRYVSPTYMILGRKIIKTIMQDDGFNKNVDATVPI